MRQHSIGNEMLGTYSKYCMCVSECMWTSTELERPVCDKNESSRMSEYFSQAFISVSRKCISCVVPFIHLRSCFSKRDSLPLIRNKKKEKCT